MSARRIPLNLYGIPFGLAGLAGVWLTAADEQYASAVVGEMLSGLSAIAWVVVSVCYVRYVCSAPRALRADLTDPVLSPFAALFTVTPMLLAAEALTPYAHTAATVLVDVFLAFTFVLGAWFTGQWIYGPLDVANLHPGYFLPTVAGGFVAAGSAGAVGQHRLAWVMFGLGLVCWLILGSMILGRLFFGPPLPTPLVPTLAIEVAPAAVASVAYFALHGPRVDAVAAGLAGYGVLMVAAQIRLIPLFAKLPFMPGFWAFTFSWAAVVNATLHWIDQERPLGHQTYVYALLIVITLSYLAVAARTTVALARDELLPRPPEHTVTPATRR